MTDNVVGGVDPGTTVTYTVTINSVGVGSGVTTNTHLEFDPDTNVWGTSATSDAVGPFQTGECTTTGGFYYNTVNCNDATGPVDDDTVVFAGVVLPVVDFILDPSPNYCQLYDSSNNGTVNCGYVGVSDAFINDWISTPETDENGPNQPHTVSFYLPPGVTCGSDPILNDGLRGCDTVTFTDVTLSGCPQATIVSVLNSDTNLNSDADIDVTIISPSACTVTITLSLIYDMQNATPLTTCNAQTVFIYCLDLVDAQATKTYAVVGAGADGEIRHRDEPDLATEDAAGITDSDPLDPYCNVVITGQCGILAPQDDLDDAIGSFHEACIINSLLLGTVNNVDITWNIQNVSGNVTINPFPAGQKIDGNSVPFPTPNDIPCVRWASGGTGTQNVTATYDNGIDPAVTFYWDNSVPLPLIKEWNDIDETHIVAATGVVGDDLTQNTGELADWGNRDCSTIPADPGFCTRPNLDGLTLEQAAALVINSQFGLLINAPGRSFIDYTFGDHSDVGGIYSGPVDGAQQTYTISGDCGSVRLEDPTTGNVIILSNSGLGQATVLSSDKGVGFTFLPNDDGNLVTDLGNGDCGPESEICITIETEEDNLFHSPPIDTADEEEICIIYVVGPPTSKTPILAWAGERVVLEHYWGAAGLCAELDFPNGDPNEFGILYTKQNGPGAFTAALQGNTTDVDLTSSDVIVDVQLGPTDLNQDNVTDPNSNCTSRVIYESEDQGEVDISAFAVDDNDNLNNADPRSQQVAFVIYYMKFEDVTLQLIPGQSGGHSTSSQNSSVVTVPEGAASFESNVSANVLARATVRGWVLTDNCPARDSRVGDNGEFIPANRCIFPDDWAFKAGGPVVGPETRPNFDIYGGTSCTDHVAGPFSLLDILPDGTAGGCDDGLAPHYPADSGASNSCATGGLTYSCRDVMYPNGIIDKDDAPMPYALIRFLLSGSGYLFGADKSNYFVNGHIPAEPWIAPINFDLSGYQWNTWGVGGKSGLYDFWTDYADTGPEVVSCARNSTGANVTQADPCPNEPGVGVPTGGYNLTRVYSDEHGIAMTWVNGDANLSFDDCASSAASAGHSIVLLNGFYCEDGDLVGSSTLNALVDYPDKRKHFAIDSNDVTIDWTWGGIKDVTVEPGEGPQFHYVVLHLTDRDGFCGGSPSLHPVLGEQVNFLIDSPSGIIVPNVNGDAAAGPVAIVAADLKSAVTHTFDTDVNASVDDGGITVEPLLVDGECQAWIHVSESLLASVNVLVTAFDPEGTVTFDVIINPTPAPTAPPTASPSPTEPPPSQVVIWGDWDCDGLVNIGDAVAVARTLVNLGFDQEPGCPEMEDELQVTQNGLTHPRIWGDADCSGAIDIGDAIKIARALINLPITTFADCPGLGQQVHIPA